MRVNSAMGAYEVRDVERARLWEGLQEAWVVTDENVWSLYAKDCPCEHVRVLPPGEASKSLARFGELLSWLASTGAKRGSLLVAFGGGVVGDLAGFAASAYMRGIGLVMAPTSLMAMVDSSVGGKVGVDLPEGKNLAGAFWAPMEVRICPELLETLPPREFLSGAAEVWKYGFIADEALTAELEAEPLSLGPRLADVIARCVAHKAAVVSQDERENTGARAVLNFGHTIGHAIEAALGYKGWTHGEAVSAGMVVESRLGEALGVTCPGASARVAQGLRRQGLPTRPPEGLGADKLLGFAHRDKKADGEGLAFSLLTRIGACRLVKGVPESAVRQALEDA